MFDEDFFHRLAVSIDSLAGEGGGLRQVGVDLVLQLVRVNHSDCSLASLGHLQIQSKLAETEVRREEVEKMALKLKTRCIVVQSQR